MKITKEQMVKELRKANDLVDKLTSRLEIVVRQRGESWAARDILITAGKLHRSDWDDAVDLVERPAGYAEWEAKRGGA